MRWHFLLLFPLLVSAVAPSLCGATITWDVALNTTGLASSASGPFTLDIQLNDGGLPGNNTATLSDFSFGGGVPVGMPDLFGGAAGSLTSAVTLADTDFFNDFRQSFTAGNLLSFRLVISTNDNGTGTPDEFSLAILDNTGVELPTASLATVGSSVVLLADLTGDGTQVQSFGSASGAAITFGAPSLAAPTGEVPEPSTLIPMALICVAGLAMRRLR